MRDSLIGTQSIEPWFPENVEKEQYIALLNSDSEVPEHHLKAALLRRAMQAVRRVVHVQQEKPALQQLMRLGSIGDDLWRDFSVAEQETMRELQAIAQDANEYKAGWGQVIFTTAAQMLEHEKQKSLQTEMQAIRKVEEKKWATETKRREQEAREAEERRIKEAKKAERELLRMEEEENKSQ